MTVRSEGQFNTVVYEEEDIYRGQERRDVVLLNPEDMRRFGLTAETAVTVRSDVGELQPARPALTSVRQCADVLPGSNVLVPRDVDPQ